MLAGLYGARILRLELEFDYNIGDRSGHFWDIKFPIIAVPYAFMEQPDVKQTDLL